MASSRRKIRVILQRDSMQCGVACLCMIGRYWGIKCSLSGLGEVCHTTSEGVSMKGIMDAAQKIGLDCNTCSVIRQKLGLSIHETNIARYIRSLLKRFSK